mgnify:CR=1 FL=1
MKETVLEKLQELNIAYKVVEHTPVYTIEEMDNLGNIFEGAKICKNLFVRDQKGKRHFLVTCDEKTEVNLKDLGKRLGAGNISFASEERLEKYHNRIEKVREGIIELLTNYNIKTGLRTKSSWSDDLDDIVRTFTRVTEEYKNILKELDYVDIEGTGLITIFKKQLKALIKIKANPYASAESLGISTGQYSALKFGCLKLYTEKQLIFMYRFITSLYKDLMAGRYTFDSNNRINNKKFVHYITLNLIQLGKVR